MIPSNIIAMDTCGAQDEPDLFEDIDEVAIREAIANMPGPTVVNAKKSENEPICPRGTHTWRRDLCMVCTVCRECTGYSSSCLSSMRPDRNPGQ